MSAQPSATPKLFHHSTPSTRTTGWFNRLKVGPKISLGYAAALGIAMGGTIIGIAVGNSYQQQAQNLQADAIDEILDIKDLRQSLTQVIAEERELITWLDNPERFQSIYELYRNSTEEFEEEWAELLAEYEEDIEEGIEEADEIEFLENLIENYDGIVSNYFKDVDQIISELNLTELQDKTLIEAKQRFIDLNRRPNAIEVEEFAEQLSKLAEIIEEEELAAAADVIQTAAQLRTQVITISIVLSLIIASFLALLISRAINRPLKAVEETALRVTREGNFDLRATVTSNDEIGTLSIALNQLIEWVSTYTRSLKEAQQELEEQTQELNAIIDNLGDGLLVTDSQGCITRANPALRGMFSLNDTQLNHKPAHTIFDQRITELITKNQTDPTISQSKELELTSDRVGQALVTAITSAVESETEGKAIQSVGSVVLIRDITAEKEVDRMKTDFISTVSHELRTPLTSVLGFAKLIQKKLEETVLPAVNIDTKKTERAARQVRENLNIIVSEGERLTSLINDVLDIAKIEAGKIEWNMQPIAIAEIIERAIAAISVLLQTSGLDIIRDIESDLPEVVGDRDRLIQVLINLFSNAIKFTDSGSVTCRVFCQNNEVSISIIDTGIGLASDDLEKVFEKFKQIGEVMTDKPKGTGLGLPICKQIIEHHGGRIWAESTLGEGSTFSFTLPLNIPVESGIAKVSLQTVVEQLKDNVDRTIAPERKTQKTILVVDDEPHIRTLLRQELEATGYQVQEAKDGMDALRKIKATPPDLIVMDVMMPNINGFDLAAVLKSNPATMNIPTIVLSIIQDQERGYRLGVDRYLSKPIDTDTLLHDIKTLLTQGASNRKVLVVDMDTSTTKTLMDVLVSKGYQVIEASTGHDSIEKALSLKPDMIIVDSAISTEHELVKTLRFDNGLENIFIIMMDHQLVPQMQTQECQASTPTPRH
ncbi:MAG: ATP-binding protein [Cyanobacteria bacterium P01_A01_bin.37]